MQNKKIHSIRIQFVLIFGAILFGVMLVFLLVNGLLINKVYLMNKTNVLKDAYELIVSSMDDGEFYDEMENISAKNGISCVIVESSGESVYSTGGEGDRLSEQFQFFLFGSTESKVISQTEDYKIERSEDMAKNGDYLVLIGNLDDSMMVMMKIAISNLNESALIALRLNVMVSILCIIIGAIVVFGVTRVVTNPILRLTSISKRMTELDFDARYEVRGKRYNEIDELGEHMNQLSKTLEETISELKTANNEMKLDLDRKEQIEMMRTDFLSNVSHELKTPLALISGYAEGLKDSVNSNPADRDFYCDVIIDEADKMSKMVKKLLTLNQLEFGANEITMERFFINDLVDDVVSNMRIMLESDGIDVSVKSDGKVAVWADEFKVEEVLTNYLSNAIHHVGGEKKISITIERKDKNVRVGVFNTGTPIPSEDIERLWEKFFKVDKSHSRQYGGSGIGLSIVKAIMDALHQSCGVQNHEDGVEFWFELDASAFEEGEISGQD